MGESNESLPMDSDDPQEIEAAFVASWDFMVEWYIRAIWDISIELELPKIDPAEAENSKDLAGFRERNGWVKPIMGLIAEMRQRGYDRKFRAGQQLFSFVLSRSREHGLRGNQAALSINIHPQGGMEIYYWSRGKSKETLTLKQEQIVLTPEVEQLLARLLEQPID